MAVNPPGLKDAIHVAVRAGPTDVVHDLVASIFKQRLADFGSERVEHFIPGGALELAGAARADALQWIENPLRIVDLIDRGRPLGAVSAT